ncbi:MAG: hypothetical protein HFE98_10395 [Ruminiclostridium sp.]|nr:hypothetical protein [Ruminiclostridium sp.]
MRRKTKLYLALGLCGVLVLALTLPLKGCLSQPVDGILIGLGSAMVGLGVGRFALGRFEETHPRALHQAEIEAKDERNQAIRFRAQAQSGVVLQWLTMAAAWLCILMDGPLWFTLAAVGVFTGKTVLELGLMAYHQQRM